MPDCHDGKEFAGELPEIPKKTINLKKRRPVFTGRQGRTDVLNCVMKVVSTLSRIGPESDQ